MTPDHKPAEAFHLGEYIADELAARGWSTRDCAMRMRGDVATNWLALDILCVAALWKPEVAKSMQIGGLAKELAEVLGVELQTILNIDKAWREFHGYDN